MKTRFLLLILACAGIACGFTVTWSTIDGGGGRSTGGTYAIEGTIGQPDAGAMTGGNYTLTGGYWSMPEIIPVPGGPELKFRTVSGTVYLTWPAPSPGWRLEASSDLVNWTGVPAIPAAAGGLNHVPADLTAGLKRRCYRLTFP